MKNFDHHHDPIPTSGTYTGIIYDTTTIVIWGEGREATRYRIQAKTGMPTDTPVKAVVVSLEPRGYNAHVTPVKVSLDDRLE